MARGQNKQTTRRSARPRSAAGAASGFVPSGDFAADLSPRSPRSSAEIAQLDMTVIHRPAELRRLVKILLDCDTIALDIETASTVSGYDVTQGTPSLIQIGIDDPVHGRRQFVVDCFDVDPEPLMKVMRDPSVEKIIHNSAYEQRWFAYHWGVEITNVFCTYTAFQKIRKQLLEEYDAAGLERPAKATDVKLGLAYCSERALGVQMDKSEQGSLWSRPQLSKSQLEYAALDVAVLHPLAEVAKQRATELGVLEDAYASAGSRYATTMKGLQEKRDGREGRFDASYRVTAALARCSSLSELDEVWASSRQIPIWWEQREVCERAYRQRRAELKIGAPAKGDEDDIDW